MTGTARRWTAAALFAAALGGQFLLQQPLGHANEVRASRRLHAAPSSMALRLSAGGVKEAAADALWLTVLPRLGRSWVEQERKAAWIENVVTAMTDANPRALTPVVYGAYFLERQQRRHPAIERVVLHAMEAKVKPPFEKPRLANGNAWQLPEVLGMNLYIFGTPEEKDRAEVWLREAARKPTCPSLVVDFLEVLRARKGNPLEGWELRLQRAANTENPEHRRYFLQEADLSRLTALRKWAAAAETRLGRWPRTVDEILAEAPEVEKDTWTRVPGRRDALVDGVVLHAETRDIEIPSLTEAMEREGKEVLRLLLQNYELTTGKRASSMKDLDSIPHRAISPPPRHGTRWGIDPATGEPEVVPDFADPRARR